MADALKFIPGSAMPDDLKSQLLKMRDRLEISESSLGRKIEYPFTTHNGGILCTNSARHISEKK